MHGRAAQQNRDPLGRIPCDAGGRRRTGSVLFDVNVAQPARAVQAGSRCRGGGSRKGPRHASRWMGRCAGVTRRWALRVQARAESRLSCASGAPSPVVSGGAQIKGVAAVGRLAGLIPGRRRIHREHFGARPTIEASGGRHPLGVARGRSEGGGRRSGEASSAQKVFAREVTPR